MTEATEHKTIYELMGEVSRTIGAIAKTRKTESGARYNFRGIDDVFDAIHEPLADAGIIPTSEVISLSLSERVSQGDKGDRYQTVVVLTKRVHFIGPLGDEVWTDALGEAQDYGDKAVAKAESIAFRTAMIQAFTIPITDTDVKIDTESDNSPRSGQAVQSVSKPKTKVDTGPKPVNLSGLFAMKDRNGESVVPSDDHLRHKWASVILEREIKSFTELTEDDVAVLKKEAKKQALASPKSTGFGESQEPF